ncbi:CapA family protein [Alkalicoccus halolimnae]|uniref:CapA family protein n=1 Tax=Alkalicoccus halolimnae TaxID=1667239 RepID=A0A5C7FCV4_9BACI|nr:CapA family protein [Alkalicoccus halolimnae]TXF82324.1 CapA family protein [Alkalicoccus halolimnae]
MERKYTFQERMKLMQIKHKKTALRDSLIVFAVIAIPFFGYSMFIPGEVPEETREDNVDYRMTMVGDMMMGRHVLDAANQSGENIDRVFNYVRPFLDDSDYVTGNFENPVIDDEDPEIEAQIEDAELHNKNIHFYAQPDSLAAVEAAGFDSISVANNHALDYGDLSLQQTLEHGAQTNLELLGIGDALGIDPYPDRQEYLSEEEASEEFSEPEPVENSDGSEREALDASRVETFENEAGVRFGIIGFTDVFVRGFSASDYVGGVFTSDVHLPELRQRLLDAKAPLEDGGLGVDVLMVHTHWGAEYQVGFNERQEELARYMTNYGADMIIGHHSHVLEPISIVEGRDGHRSLVMNSLGNFVFDQGWSRTKESAMAQLDFLEDGSKEVSFVPLSISESMPRETAGVLKSYQDFRIFRTLRKEIDSDYWDVENGRLKIDLDAAGIMEGVDTTS